MKSFIPFSGIGGLGFLVFLFVYGEGLLDPAHFAWLSSGDPAQSFFGFNFFLNEPWHFPPGRILNFNSPMGTTPVYSDSFPLVSLFFKTVHFLVHPFSLPFQFVGVWIAFCFVAQGLASYGVLLRETRDSIFSFFGSIIFILSPALVFRSIEATPHYSLMGHFFVILALGEWIAWARRREYRHWAWCALLGASLGIHFYLFAMVAFLYLIPCVESLIENRESIGTWVKRQALLGVFVIVLALLYGYSGVSVGDAQGGGFGLFAMDLFAWFVSEGWALSQPFPDLNYLIQREGFQYLGLGVLAGLAWLALEFRFFGRRGLDLIRKYPVPASVFSFLFLIALSRRLWIFGSRLSIFITLPFWLGVFYWFVQKVRPMGKPMALAISFILLVLYNLVGPMVRSSGRMGWPLSYGLMFVVLLGLHERKRLQKYLLLGLVLVQIIDLYPLHSRVREKHWGARDTGKVNPESSVLREFLHAPVKRIVILVENEYFQNAELNFFALENSVPIGPVYLARFNHAARRQLLAEWRKKLFEHQLTEGEYAWISQEQVNRDVLDSIRQKGVYRTLPWSGGLLVGL
jgi:hypothetical protein